jgi:hypothetical protein
MSDMETNAIVFWDAEGVEIITIIGDDEIESETLLEIFDTEMNRMRILAQTGRLVDNTSEEFIGEV